VHDRIGRRRTFALFATMAGISLVAYFLVPTGSNSVLLIVGFPLGFFASGCFSGFGSYLSELFPTHVRGTGAASVTTSAAASARCSRASSASSPTPSGSAARWRSACSAT
jgi:MFS family permease